jgi:hypothetical protein
VEGFLSYPFMSTPQVLHWVPVTDPMALAQSVPLYVWIALCVAVLVVLVAGLARAVAPCGT